MELQEEIFTKIVSLVNKGKLSFQKKNFEKAIVYYMKARAIFPVPIEEYKGAEQLYILLGDACFASKKYEKAQEYYIQSQNCVDKDQYLNSKFKIGKIFYEIGKTDLAKNYFQQVYDNSGKKLFYFEDAKYYNLITYSENKGTNKEEKQNSVYKSFKGKNYTKEEWDIFEQRQWEEYLIKKGNISKKNEKGLFLDEK